MKEITLTRGQVTIVDDEDYEKAIKIRWYAGFNRHTKSFYAQRTPRKNERSLFLHRIVTDAPPGAMVDHINHDTLDNRRENLRLVDKYQNMHNARARIDAPLGLKGIVCNKGKRGDTYTARIGRPQNRKTIGTFKTLREAVVAYNKTAREWYGEYAYQIPT